jgi:hypothetical protein
MARGRSLKEANRNSALALLGRAGHNRSRGIARTDAN